MTNEGDSRLHGWFGALTRPLRRCDAWESLDIQALNTGEQEGRNWKTASRLRDSRFHGVFS